MHSTPEQAAPRATENDGAYPRPQLMRSAWKSLDGQWGFAFDDEDEGRALGWGEAPEFERSITVPFPPESAASGIEDTSLHRVFWYHRPLTTADIVDAGHQRGRRLMLRFGAVDYRADVWVNGHHVGSHEGGHTPFAFDITDELREGEDAHIVVRAEDDPSDVAQPRGKQDWREDPHVIWYHRTSGIWQPVWLESVPALAITGIQWQSDLHTARVTARVLLTETPRDAMDLDIELCHGDRLLARTTVLADSAECEAVLTLSAQTNGQAYEELLWTPENPRLIDAQVRLRAADQVVDSVSSYLGLRSAAVDRRWFWLNDRPRYVRSVLSQGYWPESHLAAPSADALRAEVQLIKDLGFNAARVHQKFEDPRFLYWADRLGLMVWGEAPGAFTFSPTAMQRSVHEWLEVVERDRSHPSIVTWVPLNESWGVQHIASDTAMQQFARSLVALTKAVDPTRPVVSNDGWEQVDTDIIAIHDYEGDGDVVRARYRDRAGIDALIDEVGPAGRRLVLSGDTDLPVMLTEFGGISFDVHGTSDAWGYTAANSAAGFEERLRALLDAVHDSGVLAGYCYTQLTDTLQETNGLLDAERQPKLPIEVLREILRGPRPGRPG